ncbi:MAG: hypothetical protein L0170_06155, partial [Acidobacteria bacterium]|nr:hypothetical protein [Acidobacteriota bacterium]
MTAREAIGGALEKEGTLCSSCVQVVAEIRSTIRVTQVLHELEASGHVRRGRALCPGCQETRLVASRTGKDLRDVPPSPSELLRGSVLEETLLYANPCIVPGSLERDRVTGNGWITVRCLRPDCPETWRFRLNRVPSHVLCSQHRNEDATDLMRLRMGRELGRKVQHPGPESGKIPWRGMVLSVQPRIRLIRSFDERSHSYLGYVLGLEGTLGTLKGAAFLIALGEGAQEKHAFRVGDEVSGFSVPVENPELETAAYYKTSALEHHRRGEVPTDSQGPPYHEAPPPLTGYRERGHRRLDARTYATKCATCVWGCKMPVEMIIDQWNR